MKIIHQITFILMIYFPTLRQQIFLIHLVKNIYQSHSIIKMFLCKIKSVFYGFMHIGGHMCKSIYIETLEQ